ncbi:MAG: DsrE family protein [Halofilum sp. (in: g-proteobacteria)]|nr:DsrE family protein [Halofilum sp. (in: g-proteobacteria)]
MSHTIRRLALAAATAVLLPAAPGAMPAHAAGYQETELSEPKPSFAEPRKVVLQLSSGDPDTINNVLYNAVNIQKFYGMDKVQIAVIVYGPGMEALYAESSPVRERITSLQQYDIEFVGCGNTMDATGHGPQELIDGVSWVEAGIAEIIERKLAGWTIVRP